MLRSRLIYIYIYTQAGLIALDIIISDGFAYNYFDIYPWISWSFRVIHTCYHECVIATSMFEATVGRGALWAALSSTGNARYAPLLLALDVKGSNDLAAKAEAAIAGGMSQADIEAVLAFNTPAAPEAVQGRKDHPTLIQASGKASLTLALAAAQPNQRRQALEALDNDMLAKSTKPAHESRLPHLHGHLRSLGDPSISPDSRMHSLCGCFLQGRLLPVCGRLLSNRREPSTTSSWTSHLTFSEVHDSRRSSVCETGPGTKPAEVRI